MSHGRLDRYVLRLFLGRLGITVTALLSLYLAIDLVERLKRVSQQQLPLELVFRFLLARTPLALTQVLPLAGLFASALTVTTLSRRQELTALRAAGIAPARAVAALLLGGALTAAAHVGVSELWLPATREEGLAAGVQALAHRRAPAGAQWYAEERLRYRVAGFEPDGRLKQLEVITLDETGHTREHLLAAHARWDGHRWTARDAAVWTFLPDGTARFSVELERPLTWRLPPERMVTVELAPEYLSYGGLEAAIAQGRASGRDVRGLVTSLELRRLLPFTCFLLVLMGIPRGASPARNASLAAAIAQALAIGVVYLLTTGMGLLLVQRGHLDPLPGLWLPQGLWFAFGLVLLLRMR